MNVHFLIQSKESEYINNTFHPFRNKKGYAFFRKTDEKVSLTLKYFIMKKGFFIALLAIAAMAAMSSCAKDIITEDPFADGLTQDNYGIFDIDLQFDAPEITQTTVFFFDAKGVQVNAQTLSVPVNESEVVNASFVSETKPVYLYTPGLQNVDANGYLRIPEGSVATKAGKAPVKLVIR